MMSKCTNTLIATLLFSAPSEAAKTIKKLPITIKKSGTYVLKKDQVYKNSSGAAIAVEAPNVTIDLGGFLLSTDALANDTNGTIGISWAGTGMLTVRNGTVRGFLHGLQLEGVIGSGRVTVEDVIVEGSGSIGIRAAAEAVTVRSCQVRNTGFVTTGVVFIIVGISVTAATSRIEHCRVDNLLTPGGQDLRGIESQAARGSTIHANEVRSAIQFDIGIAVFLGTANFVTDNAIANCVVGLGFINPAQGKYRDNLTEDCATPFQGGTSVGTNS